MKLYYSAESKCTKCLTCYQTTFVFAMISIRFMNFRINTSLSVHMTNHHTRKCHIRKLPSRLLKSHNTGMHIGIPNSKPLTAFPPPAAPRPRGTLTHIKLKIFPQRLMVSHIKHAFYNHKIVVRPCRIEMRFP